MSPADLAAKLTPAQRSALLWMPACGAYRDVGSDRPPLLRTHDVWALGLCAFHHNYGYRLTPLGQEVRAILAKGDA